MSNFPEQVRDYIFNQQDQKYSIAYLRIDPVGKLKELGGSLQIYELNHLKIGQSIEHSIDYLDGFLPVADHPFTMENIQIKSDLFVDVHVFLMDGDHWILWANKTSEIKEKQQLQQHYNELNLLQHKYEKVYKELIKKAQI
jgi:hypothetical protein